MLNSLKNVEGVVEAYIVYGVYDLVAKIRANSIEELKEVVTAKIRKMPKVKSTLTMIVVESQPK